MTDSRSESTTDSRVAFDIADLADDVLEEEGLFARDIDGQLIRVEKATADELDQDVTLTINGREITVKKAVPTRDRQGNIINDRDGFPVPRLTSIYDAASAEFVRKPGDQHPIPTLCHREHLPPIGVCRVCLVEATEMTPRGPRRKLVPSCVQRVSPGMTVHTIGSQADPAAGERVQAASGMLVELLMADHLPDSQQNVKRNELTAIADRLGIGRSRLAGASGMRGRDSSSRMIAVDHDQCIMCGRCQRGCNWVKHNNVIGRAGKGYEATIAFDLGDDMAASHCVSCGECAISCPTGALEFTETFIDGQVARLKDELQTEGRADDVLTADDLMQIPLFAGIPYKFLQFNAAAVQRRVLTAGDVLCREGEYGSTAFVILRGEFEVLLNTQRGAVRTRAARGLLGWLGGLKTVTEKVGGTAKLTDVRASAIGENEKILMDEQDVLFGEMSCLNNYPRSATVVATRDAEVLEVKRNVLHML